MHLRPLPYSSRWLSEVCVCAYSHDLDILSCPSGLRIHHSTRPGRGYPRHRESLQELSRSCPAAAASCLWWPSHSCPAATVTADKRVGENTAWLTFQKLSIITESKKDVKTFHLLSFHLFSDIRTFLVMQNRQIYPFTNKIKLANSINQCKTWHSKSSLMAQI